MAPECWITRLRTSILQNFLGGMPVTLLSGDACDPPIGAFYVAADSTVGFVTNLETSFWIHHSVKISWRMGFLEEQDPDGAVAR